MYDNLDNIIVIIDLVNKKERTWQLVNFTIQEDQRIKEKNQKTK